MRLPNKQLKPHTSMSAFLLLFPLLTLFFMLGGVAVFCFDEDSSFPFGQSHRFFSSTLPSLMKSLLSTLPFGAKIISCCASSGNYVMNRRNPILQIFYLILVVGGFFVWLYVGYPYIPNPRLGEIHQFLPFLAVNFTMWTFFVASRASPGYVTKNNSRQMEKVYPYDGFIFVTGRTCSTCGTPRVARSKHCRMMGKCVERYDHFCPWINTAVGARNMKWFLLFVFSSATFLLYGAYVLGSLLLFFVDRDRLWDVKFVNSATQEIVDADLRIVFQYMLGNHGALMFLFVLCVVMGFTLCIFFLYQLYLVSYGVTTSENIKWGTVSDFYSSDRWKQVVSQRLKDPNQKSDADILRDSRQPLEDRTVEHFPNEMPQNLYTKGGLFSNLKELVYPPSLKSAHKAEVVKLPVVVAVAASGGATVLTTETSVSSPPPPIIVEEPSKSKKANSKKKN